MVAQTTTQPVAEAFAAERAFAVDRAIAAWRAISGDASDFGGAAVIADGEKSLVVRLHRPGPGPNVMAKRASPDALAAEVHVYTHLLAGSGARPRFRGVGDDGAGGRWIFIEDAGGEAYDAGNPAHARLAGQWLARLHATVMRAAGPADVVLPHRGAAFYLDRARSARSTLDRRLSDACDVGDAAIVRRCVAICDSLEAGWASVAAAAAAVPDTLVHGDIAAENVRIDGDEVVVFDWEKAAWGTPAVDLARVDVAAYASAAGDGGRPIGLDDVARAAAAGSVLRTLSHNWAAKPVGKLERYARRLAREMRRIGVEVESP
ncbi:MAG TPA: phosphotransferase [Dehalococcoidia bacterium]|nr:phosphotransferase [Dehalococcoidia bacterium]